MSAELDRLTGCKEPTRAKHVSYIATDEEEQSGWTNPPDVNGSTPEIAESRTDNRRGRPAVGEHRVTPGCMHEGLAQGSA